MNNVLDGKLVTNQPEPKIELSLSIAELNIVLAGLQELPHKISNLVINNIIEQANKQVETQQ